MTATLERPAGGGEAPSRASRPRQLADAIAAHRVDIGIVVALTVAAALLRLWRLGTVPDGLHGDEAWTALDAQRILREGWIGPYVTSALGQPTGPLYFTAALFKIMPETTFTARFSMALFGIATIPVAYGAFALMYNRTVAAFGAALLTVMMWHLHLSRTAFMVVSWPFAEVLVLFALWLAMRRRSVALFAVAGIVHGLGVYTYNAYLLFAPVPFVAILWASCREPGWRRRARYALVKGGVFAVFAIVAALPMIEYVRAHSHDYREHERIVRVTASPQWQEEDALGRARIIWDRAGEWERGLFVGGRADFGDGLATDGHPAVGPIVAALALVGLGFSMWNWRRAEHAVLLACLLLLPLGALATYEDGLFRRTLGLAPVFAVLAALPLAWLWERGFAARDQLRGTVAMATTLIAVAVVGVYSTVEYFGAVQNTEAMRFVYPYQIDAASRYIDELPKDTYVYFYSDRWSFEYETRRFLAPGYAGEDRSTEFGPPVVGPGEQAAPDRSRNTAYVFLGTYIGHAKEVIDKYPGGGVSDAWRGDEIEFEAYFLPRLGGRD
ncbi:MAG: hypothetical protein EPO22_11195 [Dehalococcoidia bacterium]|nr:MAG: hypothetical protein EPO22_11195 [Dehalococcoidia bacterium]